MEWNGMPYDVEGALAEAKDLQQSSDELLREFRSVIDKDFVSITSGDDVSVILYGGIIEEIFSVPIGHFKSGPRKGEIKYGKETLEHNFPRLVAPIKDTETAKNKAGKKATWSVAEDVLKKLKAKGDAKKIINIILEYRGLEKLRNTYLEGWADLIEKKHWEPGMIHGNLNQCVTITGRLSSDSPNMQNPSKAVKKFLITRYANGRSST